MSPNETSPLLPDAQRLPRQVQDGETPILIIPEEEGTIHHFGPKLLASLAIDSVPGTNIVPLLTQSNNAPVILSYILQNSIQTAAIVVTGRLGPEQLSAAAFSMMLAYVTGEYSPTTFPVVPRGPMMFPCPQAGASHSAVDPPWTRSDPKPSPAVSTRPICPSISNVVSCCCGPSLSPLLSCGSSWNPSSWRSESPSVSAKMYKTSCAC